MKKSIWVAIVILLVFAAAAILIVKRTPTMRQGVGVRIVAAEDFYGSIAGQIAGTHATVTNIISNPDVDPHEYDATVQDGTAVADADIVIQNGLQYDAWMDKLIAASPDPARTVITAGSVAPDILPDNPHVWYGIDNAAAVAQAIEAALEVKDPADKAIFEANLAAFNTSLAPLMATMENIKAEDAGTPVGLTETIYLYETGPMGLDVITPLSFERAIAEGNDPSAEDANTANQQIVQKKIKVLIYNSQTVTPITTNLENAAAGNGIPVVPVTETMPSGVTYQQWLGGELDALQAALAK